ncbi:MAG: peptidoglycan DD-metalloendopeptidase family protein [Deltaproteobacteria bacterium]|jgi:septal ring factor EnvC (AmiA/AmiB activator)|nr:peptidoglycan DD-metalloendopeptidase family protein [Deltaproteobacteria bacterium]
MACLFKHTILTAVIVLAGAVAVIGTGKAGAADGRAVAVVTADEVRVQSEPGRHGLLQKTLKRGSTLKIIKRRPGWIQILHDGEVGFIKAQAQTIKIVPSGEIQTDRKNLKRPQEQQQHLDEYQKRKEHISREIEQGQQEVEAFSRKESDTIKRLNQVEQTLNKSIQRTAATKREIKKLQGAIREATDASDKLRAQIRTNEKYVAQRLIALYKMNWLGRFHLLASAGSMHEFIQRKAALERILAHDEKIRQELLSDQDELEKVLSRLNELKDQKSILADELQKQIQQMSTERSARTRLLADIRSQKALELAAIDALTQASNELDRKINLLNTSGTSPAADKKASRLPFSAHKGLLIRPVNGRIISLYGPYKNPKYDITNFRSGIDIEADNGEPVRSVFNGRILYSSWFKTYGNMIIIDHGKNYYTVYAHLEEAFKAKGDEVETGEVIATVGDTGSMTGTKLYFEVRHHGKPVNPMPWLKN